MSKNSDHVQARACYSAPVSPAGSWDRKPVGGVWDLEDDLDLDSELGCYEDPSYFQHVSPSGTPRKAMALPAPRFHVSPGELATFATPTSTLWLHGSEQPHEILVYHLYHGFQGDQHGIDDHPYGCVDSQVNTRCSTRSRRRRSRQSSVMRPLRSSQPHRCPTSMLQSSRRRQGTAQHLLCLSR